LDINADRAYAHPGDTVGQPFPYIHSINRGESREHMNPTHPASPPRIATWLLKHCGVGPNHDAIIGDLVEQYQHGRSRWWFRKQVALAILCGSSGYLVGFLAGAVGGAVSIAGNVARNGPHGTSFFPDLLNPLALAMFGYVTVLFFSWVFSMFGTHPGECHFWRTFARFSISKITYIGNLDVSFFN
jgi:hypothetical protein